MLETLDTTVGTRRPPAELMTPERLGALQPTRLSASRALAARMVRERWSIDLVEFDVDERARGTARYVIQAGDARFEFVAFSFEPVLEGRTDRIIGRNWDMMGALLEGHVDEARLRQTREELPKLYGGRAASGTLIWARANRSMRLFDVTIEALAAGRQPPVGVLGAVCYLMRNIGLDGNGTFGTRSFLDLGPGHALRAPLHAQMLASYLMREFSFDLVEHLARARGGERAVPLDRGIKRFLGLGNGSGLGLLFFGKNHPALLDRWLRLGEDLLARATALPAGEGRGNLRALEARLARVAEHKRQDQTRYTNVPSGPEVAEELEALRAAAAELLDAPDVPDAPFGVLRERAAERHSLEAQELLHTQLIELVPDEADALVEQLIVDEELRPEPAQRVGALLEDVREAYGWTAGFDLDAPGARDFGWYKSEDAEEPRRGPLADLPEGFDDLTLDLVAWIPRLTEELAAFDPDATVGAFLRAHPHERALVERIQTLSGLDYHTPRINWRDGGLWAAYLIRVFNSAIHGLDKTAHPDANGVVGVLFHGAPVREDLPLGEGADWPYPIAPEVAR